MRVVRVFVCVIFRILKLQKKWNNFLGCNRGVNFKNTTAKRFQAYVDANTWKKYDLRLLQLAKDCFLKHLVVGGVVVWEGHVWSGGCGFDSWFHCSFFLRKIFSVHPKILVKIFKILGTFKFGERVYDKNDLYLGGTCFGSFGGFSDTPCTLVYWDDGSISVDYGTALTVSPIFLLYQKVLLNSTQNWAFWSTENLLKANTLIKKFLCRKLNEVMHW